MCSKDSVTGGGLYPGTVLDSPAALDTYRLQLYQYAMATGRLVGYPLVPQAPYYPPRLALSLLNPRGLPPDEPKPQYSYIGLIAMAILSSPEMKLVLSDIYQYILDNYPYFRTRGPGWRNSIRHNLSLNDCFVKAGRSANGKGHYWAIHPANVDDFRKGDFRRRKAQRKVRKHMGLAVDEDGTDSPSPPPTPCSPPPLPQIPRPLWHTPAPLLATPPLAHQSRKRQFDVASLLAPDEDCPGSKRTASSSDEDDIDVVGSASWPPATVLDMARYYRSLQQATSRQLLQLQASTSPDPLRRPSPT